MVDLIPNSEAYHAAYQRSIEDPEGFWAEVASGFYWQKPWDRVLEWNFEEPSIRWFSGAQLNITENCLDRHLDARGDQPALISCLVFFAFL